MVEAARRAGGSITIGGGSSARTSLRRSAAAGRGELDFDGQVVDQREKATGEHPLRLRFAAT
jgi:hypothetical protein